MKRTIKKSCSDWIRNYGSGIACHFANIGVEVHGHCSRELTDAEAKRSYAGKQGGRNRLVNEHLSNS
jgi:3-hydroxyacyl-CoA dehydrogenase